MNAVQGDKEKIWAYRKEHGVSSASHATALVALDWTEDEYDIGAQRE